MFVLPMIALKMFTTKLQLMSSFTRPIMCQVCSLQTCFAALLMRRKMSVVDLMRRKMFCVAKLIGCLGSFVALQADVTMATCAGGGVNDKN